MSIVVAELPTCRGCAPNYTYHYEVQKTTPNLKYLGTEKVIPTENGLVGGSIIYKLSFERLDDKKGIMYIDKYNAYNQLIEHITMETLNNED